ncbi:hypothetical protein BAE44_0021691 [Dichanthelium oligosanthes]|uniref:AN1-type domain-containing protein n=1 Tax=Dichanthelium oligosanthes TaxID=888268 RepID=A0A1E5UWW6_9POAL|nr:hypothetical protein BAE44_0021691 [Dichanthelium oligosanthes]
MSSFQQQGSYKNHCPVNGAEPSANSSTAAAAAVASRPAVAATPIGTTASSPSAEPAAGVSFAPATKATSAAVAESPAVPSSSGPAAAKKVQPTRCAACYKKVGLLGFVCRCTKTFCGIHRYAEEHGCSFDFRGAGRDAIARNNPLVQGEKLSGKI